MPLLRREVELPLRAHQRAPFFLGVASLLLSFAILADAALCSHPAASPAARTPAAAHAAARLTRFRCPAAARRAAAATDPQLVEFRRQARQQLERPRAIAEEELVHPLEGAPLPAGGASPAR